jgi:hypothetical protein
VRHAEVTAAGDLTATVIPIASNDESEPWRRP